MDFLYEDNGNSNLAKLYNMISHLDALEKAIVLLYLEDRPYEEIASMIGISKTNVGTKLSRIKEKLRKMSNQNEYNYGTR